MKLSKMKRKETRNRRNPKSMLKGQKKGKPTKDKRHFNSTAVNHTESALRRETHKGKGKRKEHKEQKQPCTKNIFVNITGLVIHSIILLLHIIYHLFIQYKSERRCMEEYLYESGQYCIFFCYQEKYYQGLRYSFHWLKLKFKPTISGPQHSLS